MLFPSQAGSEAGRTHTSSYHFRATRNSDPETLSVSALTPRKQRESKLTCRRPKLGLPSAK